MMNQFEMAKKVARITEVPVCLGQAEKVYILNEIKENTRILVELSMKRRTLSRQVTSTTPILTNVTRSLTAGHMMSSLEKAVEEVIVNDDMTPPRSPISHEGSPSRARTIEYDKLCTEFKEVCEEIKVISTLIHSFKEALEISNEADKAKKAEATIDVDKKDSPSLKFGGCTE